MFTSSTLLQLVEEETEEMDLTVAVETAVTQVVEVVQAQYVLDLFHQILLQ
jgi:hypothetical protein